MVTPVNTHNLPIGVFDSGVGGLTVLRELRKLLPRESFIYFGDTARVPYGSKSQDIVRTFSMQIGAWLAQRPAKAVVVACNTASALALPALHERLSVPVFGVIQPGASAAVSASNGTIGVLATRATIASDAYQKAIHRIDTSRKVISVAAPLLVPLIEEGEISGEIAKAVLEKYLSPLRSEKCDTILLGCTHYPLLKPLLSELWNEAIAIDSAQATAQIVSHELTHRKLNRTESSESKTQLFLTDSGGNFLSVAELFLGEKPVLSGTVRIDELETSLALLAS